MLDIKMDSKLKSIEFIRKFKLNTFEEDIFFNGDIDKINGFLEKTNAIYYAIRDKDRENGVFKLKVLREEVLNSISDYNKFSINVSSYNYIEDQILVGEIYLNDNNGLWLIASQNVKSLRDVYKNPSYNLCTDIFDKKLNCIHGFDYIYKYVSNHNLIGVIVEFSVFNKSVGIYKDNVIIWELRNISLDKSLTKKKK